MTTPRNRLINLEATSYYHCISRCVRGAYLTGIDVKSGKNYEHRRQWIEDRLFFLTEVFTIEICSYAIMDNHYHLVLHVDNKQAIKWTFREIFERWIKLHKPVALVERFLANEQLDESLMLELARLAAEYRRRLMSISWFMREINEVTARRSNKEDDCKGRFWESRYTSQALVDPAAVLSCMAYVDLNSIRAGMSQTPEQSKFTSIQTRIRRLLGVEKNDKKRLKPFVECDADSKAKPDAMELISEKQYVALVDWTGRMAVKGKRGSIPENIAPLLTRLGIEEDEWLVRSKFFHHRFHCVAGFWESIVNAAKQFKRNWFQGKPSKEVK